uniref:Uncharacterized protein n=1 Tax=Rhizophora mucronata TaxID=61149 RepID=A0A2P2Q625_RHIMU
MLAIELLWEQLHNSFHDHLNQQPPILTTQGLHWPCSPLKFLAAQ